MTRTPEWIVPAYHFRAMQSRLIAAPTETVW